MNESQTAIRQVEALGFSATDVRHLVPTHLDIDHAGGLPDFPEAELHVWRPEMEAVQSPSLKEKLALHEAPLRARPEVASA